MAADHTSRTVTNAMRREEILEDLRSADTARRRQAILALGELGDARELPALLETSRADPSLELRHLARCTIRRFAAPASPGAADAGATIALDDPDPARRIVALLRVVSGEDGRFLPALAVRAGVEEVTAVRAQLVFAIGVLGSRSELPIVSKFFEDPSAEVRVQAVRALELIGSGRAYIMLIWALQDPDPTVRADVVRALEQLGKANILRCCEAMLQAPETWMRRSAMHCVAVAGFSDAAPFLIKGTTDEDVEVQAQARSGLRLLAERGIAEAREAVAELEQRAQPHPRRPTSRLAAIDLSASEANEDVNGAGAREQRIALRKAVRLDPNAEQLRMLLEKLDTSPEPGVLADLIAALGRTRDPQALLRIEAHLSHGEAQVRAASVDALLAAGPPARPEALLPGLRDPDPGVRARVIRGLQAHPGVDVKACLMEMCVNPDPEFRRCAVYILTELPAAVSETCLQSLRDDSDTTVAELARHALTRFHPVPSSDSSKSIKINRPRRASKAMSRPSVSIPAPRAPEPAPGMSRSMRLAVILATSYVVLVTLTVALQAAFTSSARLGTVMAMLSVPVAACWVGVDAHLIGVRKGQAQGLWNIGPVGWFVACLGIWILTVPLYLLQRSEYLRLNSGASGGTENSGPRSLDDGFGYIACVLLICGGLAAMTGIGLVATDPIQLDLLAYINEPMRAAGAREQRFVKVFQEHAGKPDSDQALLVALRRVILPQSTLMVDELEAYRPKTETVRALHRRYVEVVKKRQHALDTLARAIEGKDEALAKQGSQELNEFQVEQQKWTESLRKLVDTHHMALTP